MSSNTKQSRATIHQHRNSFDAAAAVVAGVTSSKNNNTRRQTISNIHNSMKENTTPLLNAVDSVAENDASTSISIVKKNTNNKQRSSISSVASLSSPASSSLKKSSTSIQKQQSTPSRTCDSNTKGNATPAPMFGSAAVASYYFQGSVPETPVQKLVRSEQQKLEASSLRDSMMKDDTAEYNTRELLNGDNTENHTGTNSVIVNQSYLSSSSESSAGGNYNVEEMGEIDMTHMIDDTMHGEIGVMNTTVLSDTTELTASNYLTLASTHRMIAEKFSNTDVTTSIITNVPDVQEEEENQRKPFEEIVTVDKVSTVAQKQRRRQSVSAVIAQKQINTIDGVDGAANPTKRRQTLTTIPIPQPATASPVLPALVPLPPPARSHQLQPQQRERNKVAEYQRRLSDPSLKSTTTNVPGKSSHRKSTFAVDSTDATTEFSLSAKDMANLLSSSYSAPTPSATKNEQGPNQKSPSRRKSSHQEAEVDFMSPSRNTRSAVKKMGSGSNSKSPSTALDENFMMSPSRNTRNSTKKMTGSKNKSPIAKENTSGDTTKNNIDVTYKSPSRNTRSTSKAIENEKGASGNSDDTVDLVDQILFRSPIANTKDDSTADLINLGFLSPAKNTRSATKKRLSIMNVAASGTTYINDDTTTRLLDGLVKASSNNQDHNTTASFGNLLNDVVDDTRLDTSVTPTARNTRSAQKERTATQTFHETMLMELQSAVTATSPAQNTRSAQKKKNMNEMSSTTNHQENDDTAKLLLDFAATCGKTLQEPSIANVNDSFKGSISMKTLGKTDDEDTDLIPHVDGDNVLNELVVEYNQKKRKSTPRNTSFKLNKSVDMSQDSTISLDNILEAYLPQSQNEQNEKKQVNDNLSTNDVRSTRSGLLGSATSKASTIDTPVGMKIHSGTHNVHFDGTTEPHSPPSTIRFPAIEGDSFTITNVGQSPLRKALTPSRLAPSPRRFLLHNNAGSTRKSPFKTALTPTRLPPSPYRLTNPSGSRINNSPSRSSLTPTKLQPSPLRLKRSATDDHFIHQGVPSTAMKRQKVFEDLQVLVKDSVTSEVPVPASTSRVQLPSALRHKGQSSVRSNVKRVGFRSPTFAEFNKLSPAERVTPMITRQPSFSDKMYDDTAEIESDMQALMNFDVTRAGSTPFGKKKSRSGSISSSSDVDESDMSVDTTKILSIEIGEPTITLEPDMASLLQDGMANVQPHQPKPAHNNASLSEEEENTIELETDINALLNIPTEHDQEESFHVGRRSLTFDDDPTTELESNMNALFSDDNVATKLVHQERERPFASRRFSVAPTRRLSVSLDGSFDHSKSDGTVLQSKLNNESSSTIDGFETTVFDLKVGEILDLYYLESVLEFNNSDILVKIDQLMRDHGISDTMDSFTQQVVRMIASQTEPAVHPNSAIEADEANVNSCTELQKQIRLGDAEHLRGEIQSLVSSMHNIDKHEWHTWLVAATEQLSRPIEERCNMLDDEINRLNNLCLDTEQCLATISNKSVQKARKEKMNERMTEIVTLEGEIAEMESELLRFQDYLDTAEKSGKVFSDAEDLSKENLSLATEFHETENRAEVFEQKCNTLKGAMKFKPIVLNQEEFTFAYDGSIPKSCVVLTFHISTQNIVSCKANVDSSQFIGHGTQEAHKLSTVSSFLQDRIRDFCSFACDYKVHSTKAIPESLRRFEWELGRLETTAKEIATLIERYRNKVSLTHTSSSSSYQLKISFTNQLGLTLLVAIIEITEGYPFSPLDVCLDTFHSEINVESLQKILIKNAKPGFGYLLRLCDVVSTSLQSEIK